MSICYVSYIIFDAGEIVMNKTDNQKEKSNKIISVSYKNCEENKTGQCDNERWCGHG